MMPSSRRPLDHTAAPTASACVSCGAALSGPYCSACGQPVIGGRPTLRSLLRAAVGQVLDLDRGFRFTTTGLTVAPGRVITGFLRGDTVRYTHPLAYLLVAFATFALTGQLAGGVAGMTDGANRIFTATAIPVIAAVSRVVFWRGRLNYAEHLIIVVYLLGHIVLGLAVLQAATPLLPLAATPTIGLLGLAAGVGYFTWAYTRIFSRRPWLAAVGGLATLGAGLGLWVALVVQVVAFLREPG